VNLVVVVQARTGSTRLPGKVLLPLAGKPLLQRMIERIQAATTAFRLVVATTVDACDDPVRKLCNDIGVRCYSGHQTDLLDRHYQAATLEKADTVAKIPSDCPLIDPAVIDRVLTFFLQNISDFDFVSNLRPPTYPDGHDVEIMSYAVLQAAWKEASRDFEREHTTPFIWERPERFRIGNVEWETGLNYSMSHRWTIDYPQDYDFIESVYRRLWSESKPVFSMHDVLDLLKREPELQSINSRYAGLNWYRHHIHELGTVSPKETRQTPLEQ